MFKTIFSKMVIIFICILLFSLSVIGFMLNYFLGDLFSDQKVNTLNQRGETISSFIAENAEYMNDPLMLRWTRYLLDAAEEETNSYVWIVNDKGVIILTGTENPRDSVRKSVTKYLSEDSNGYLRFTDERQYKEVMSGKQPMVKSIGDFYGLFKDTGYDWLTIQKPIWYTNKDGSKVVIGAIFLHTPIPVIQLVKKSVFSYFLLAAAVSTFIAIILIYVFSLRISKPLKQIRNAAKLIAGGEFQKRLDIKSRDEIGELANSFNQMAVALQNLEEMRRGFIANVSHELRTPMTSIRGFIEGILDGVIPSERHADYLKIVRDETNRLNRLVNDLLDLARMEAGETELVLKSVNINELIRRCIIKLESLIEEKSLQVEADFEEEEMYVNADADAIERVIINLVHNATKFTDENGKISLSTYYQKGKVCVSVQDTGIGIDAEELNLVWDRFYKSDKSRGKDKTGTGLGLAIIKNIINEHEQEIWVESEVGSGTKFTFTLDRGESPD